MTHLVQLVAAGDATELICAAGGSFESARESFRLCPHIFCLTESVLTLICTTEVQRLFHNQLSSVCFHSSLFMLLGYVFFNIPA